jgi:hypothetical protein
MTDYRLRNHDLLTGQHRPAPSLAIMALFGAIGFIAIFAVVGHLADRFNPASGFNSAAASLILPVSDGSGS